MGEKECTQKLLAGQGASLVWHFHKIVLRAWYKFSKMLCKEELVFQGPVLGGSKF